MLRLITFKIDEETVQELEKVARKLGASRSEVIRRAIKQYLVAWPEKATQKQEHTPLGYKKVVLW